MTYRAAIIAGLALIFSAAVVPGASAQATGTLRGRVKLSGEAPGNVVLHPTLEEVRISLFPRDHGGWATAAQVQRNRAHCHSAEDE